MDYKVFRVVLNIQFWLLNFIKNFKRITNSGQTWVKAKKILRICFWIVTDNSDWSAKRPASMFWMTGRKWNIASFKLFRSSDFLYLTHFQAKSQPIIRNVLQPIIHASLLSIRTAHKKLHFTPIYYKSTIFSSIVLKL